MKNIITMTALALGIPAAANAQTVLAGGFGTTGLGIVNGTTYTKTGTLGTGDHPFVSASNDGTKFFASGTNKLYFIDVATMSFTDSMTLPARNIASANESDILFTISNKALYRVNTTTKIVVDSIVLGAPWLPEERPNTKEVWVSDSGKMHIVNYSSGLTQTVLNISSSPYDYGGVRFTPGGSMAFKNAATSKKIYKINAATKAIVDSVSTPSYNPGPVVTNADSTKLFVCDAGNARIFVYNTATMAPMDSINCGSREPMNIYRHPYRNEIWAINHFKDSASVYNASTHALIAAFPVAGSPWYIAFTTGVTGVNSVPSPAEQITVFPNPASANIVLSLPDDGARQVTLTDVTGKVLRQQEVHSAYESFNVSDLPAGMYFFTVSEQGSILKTVKWIKQ